MALDQVSMMEARVVGSGMRAERRWFGRICGRTSAAVVTRSEVRLRSGLGPQGTLARRRGATAGRGGAKGVE